MKISKAAKNAIYLGTLCSISYFAVYIARNLLGAVTPKMTAEAFSLDYIGDISAVYLLAYAVGQLINGSIGDWIKAKYMITVGLLSAGIASFVFVRLSAYPGVAMVAYAWAGFSLSMIYGPMTKMVSESTDLIYATRCSLGYTFASFFGSPAAGLLATFFTWETTFHISGAVLVIMAVIGFAFFTLFEKKGIVRYGATAKDDARPKKDYKLLFQRHIVKFCGISMLTGIIRTALIAFMSTYFCDYLKYSETESASIFSVTTLIISFTSFIAIFVYERLGRDMHISAFLFFAVSAVAFCVSCLITGAIANIVVMVIAIMAANAAATILWSVYCPSLRDTGLVSGITGFLDFLSYSTAALASLLLSRLVGAIDWRIIILIMAGLMAVGTGICTPYLVTRKRAAKPLAE